MFSWGSRFGPSAGIALSVLFAACADVGSPDAIDAQAFAYGELGNVADCQAFAVLDLLNASGTDADTLKGIGVHSRAASNLVAARNGADGVAGTDDDALFGDLFAVDDVPYVGPSAMDALLAFGLGACEGTVELPQADDTCIEAEVVAWVNAAADAEVLKAEGVHTRAANAVITARNGTDALFGTDDDELFTSLADIDDVPYVGPSAMVALEAVGQARCIGGFAESVFSPRPYHDSHLTRVGELLANASGTVDIAMYSMSDSATRQAVIAAHRRGVSVRILFHGAAEDRKAPAGTKSAEFESAGIEVRWVNKVMHHKFALVDGPRNDFERTGTLISGSGNWSHGAATRFDENTAIVTGDHKLSLAYQQEFERLWAHSRPVVWNEDIVPVVGTEVPDEVVAAAPGTEAYFTSDNMRTYFSSRYGETWSKDEGRVVADKLVELIDGAEHSVRLAHGHMRFRPVVAALLAAKDRGVDVRVYLDGQEYTSHWTWDDQLADYNDCLAAAVDADDVQDCNDEGMHFGTLLAESGVNLRYKYYAYRWDYSYADQMHHKYVIVDEDTVATGSYNLSPNAEWDTMENIAVFRAETYPELVQSYVDNFDAIFDTERANGTYAEFLDEVRTGTGDFPIVFTPMALSWDEVYTLKSAILDACPDVNSAEYRENAGSHRWCNR
ncbi:MAG: hypothetical protein EP330_20110 [Deltaproteobacteria bacterium]|nr:MAG: hypothetical protein EP330_20110 [Deltaproteobacteria bacterium]